MTKSKGKSKVSDGVKAVVHAAASLGEDFTIGDILTFTGTSRHSFTKAVEGGYMKATKNSRKAGGRGRAATLYTLTAKGKKLAA